MVVDVTVTVVVLPMVHVDVMDDVLVKVQDVVIEVLVTDVDVDDSVVVVLVVAELLLDVDVVVDVCEVVDEEVLDFDVDVVVDVLVVDEDVVLLVVLVRDVVVDKVV